MDADDSAQFIEKSSLKMKVVFFDDEHDSSEHEAQPDEVSQLFGLADELPEAELDRLKKIVENFKPETMKSNL